MCSDFDTVNKKEWAEAITSTFGSAPHKSSTWDALPELTNALSGFMRGNLNHTHLPGGGGLDMRSVQPSSHEHGCLELCPEQSVAYIVRPQRLFFEYFPTSPWNSFFLLELSPLEPSGVYESREADCEELVEIPPSRYLDRSHWDVGNLGHDENGDEIPLPEESRIVVRCFEGKCLIVAKRSYWNLASRTYDGRHNSMTHHQIRATIQTAIDRVGK